MVDIDWFIALIYQVLSHFFRACIENNMNWFTKINIMMLFANLLIAMKNP